MYQNNPLRVATKEVRLSYVHLNEPYVSQQNPGGKPKYSVTMLIPKSDTATKAEIDSAIKAAYEKGVKEKWKGARPQMNSPLIHDGDGLRTNGTPFGPECKGCWVLTASTGRKPGCYPITSMNAPLAPEEIYSGMYAVVTMSFYNPQAGNPVACSLDNVFKTRDGEPLSGGPSAQADAAGLDVGQYMTAPEVPVGGATPGYGGAMPATPGQATYPNTGINPITGQPMAAPTGLPFGGAAPQMSGVQINPITGQPM